MLDHYLDLLVYHRRTLFRLIIWLPLLVLFFSIISRVISPVFTASATVSMAPSRVELAYTDAWSKQNPGRPTEISTQTFIEFLHSTPVLQIAIDKLRQPSATDQTPRQSHFIADWLQRLSHFFSYYRSKIYYTLNYGLFVQATAEQQELNALRAALDVEPITGTFLLKISVSSEDPEFSAAAANALAQAYVERAYTIASSRAAILRKALQQQANKLADELSALDRSRASVLQTQGPSAIDAFNRRVQRAEDELRTARTRLLSVDLDVSDMQSDIQVIEPASVPPYPSSPKILLAFVAAILGTISAGVIGILAMDLFGKRIYTSYDLRRLFGTAFLGTLADTSFSTRWSLGRLLFRSRSKQQQLTELRTALSTHGLYDNREIFFTGFTGYSEARFAIERFRLALQDSSLSPTTLRADAERAPDTNDASASSAPPQITLLPPLNERFQWDAFTKASRAALVITLPAGSITPEEALQVREQASTYNALSTYFILVLLDTDNQNHATVQP